MLSAIDPDHHVAREAPLATPVSDQLLGDDGVVFGDPVAEVGTDRARPVDVAVSWPPGPGRAGERTTNRLTRAVREPSLEIREHLGDHPPCGGPSLIGQQAVQLDQHGHEVDVRFDRGQQLRLQEQLTQIEAIHGVTLEHLDDGRRETGADVPEPPHDTGAAPAEPSASRSAPPALVVEHSQRGIHPTIFGVQFRSGIARVVGPGAGLFDHTAEHEAPTAETLRLRHTDGLGHVRATSSSCSGSSCSGSSCSG